MTIDLFTFGETMLRLASPGALRLEQSTTLETSYGGAESNVAANLARLGKHAVWYSRLPDNPMGRQCALTMQQHGVDTATIQWDADARMGLYFVEYGKAPRGVRVWYDRDYSAASLMTPDDLPADTIQSARWMHLTGITPALSSTCSEMVTRAFDIAQEAGVPISFDVNYRAMLWGADEAGSCLRPLCERADYVFVALRDAVNLFGAPDDFDAALHEMQRQFGGTVLMTQGEQGASAYDGQNNVHADGFETVIVDRLGAGDAFASGVICRLLEDTVLKDALRFGNATASLALSVAGDIVWGSRSDVESIMNDSAGKLRR